MQIYLSLAVCLIGLVMFLIFNPPPAQPSPRSATWAEIGRLMFAFGLLAFLLIYTSGRTLSLLH